MKNKLPIVAGALLGLVFAVFGAIALLGIPMKGGELPEGTQVPEFMGVFASSGYLKLVKFFELVGGLLTMLPRTRRLGLLVLGPIIVNILAFQVLIAKGKMMFQGPFIVEAVVVLALYLLWVERAAFARLVRGD